MTPTVLGAWDAWCVRGRQEGRCQEGSQKCACHTQSNTEETVSLRNFQTEEWEEAGAGGHHLDLFSPWNLKHREGLAL